MHIRHTVFAALAALAWSMQAAAAPFPADQVPAPLKPWVGWALDGAGRPCPFRYDRFDETRCVWASPLELAVTGGQGAFRQTVTVWREGWVALPGGGPVWPQAVTAGGKALAVVEREGRPAVRLDEGVHVLSGAFAWASLPEAIPLPPHTGVVRLKVEGAWRDNPEIDGQNQLWLRRNAAAPKAEADGLSVEVFRKIRDDNPLIMEARLLLNVAGKPREETFHQAVPEGFAPLDLTSPLPARLEPDGRLRVQLKPGTWNLTVVSRRAAPADAVRLAGPVHQSAAPEVWVYEAVPSLRLAEVRGVPSIQAEQTNLPDGWRRFPAYLVAPGSAMEMTTVQRGAENPRPDRYGLSREWRLNFDGSGYQVRDTLRAEINAPARLEMGEAYDLERVGIDGADQFITRLGEIGDPGVEVRPGAVTIQAESAYDGDIRTVPAVGWTAPMQSLSAELVLPPGWRLFHAGGADGVSDSWVARWTLLDVFLVLVLSVCVFRLVGPGAGLIALPALVLVHQEFPQLAWLGIWLVLFLGLMRVLPEGRLWRFTQALRAVVLLMLVMALLPALLLHMRHGVYPQLAAEDAAMQPVAATALYEAQEDMAAPAAPPLPEAAMERGAMASKRVMSAAAGAAGSAAAPRPLYQYDPTQKTQTGRGVSGWDGRRVHLSWNGPVPADQTVRLWLMPPDGNMALAFARLAAVVWLLAVFCGMPVTPRGWGPWLRNTRAHLFGFTKAAAVAALMWAALPGGAAAQEFPPKELLDELKAKLTREHTTAPDCLPRCATIGRLHLDEQGGALRLRLEVHAAAGVMIPLLQEAQGWRPSTVLTDGAEAATWLDGGVLYLYVPEGAHQVVMVGHAGGGDSIALSLPLTPRQVTAALDGWDMQGVDEHGAASAAIQLTRRGPARSGAQEEDGLTPAPMPLFAVVERTLTLGVTWEVETTVRRVSGGDSGGALEIPLLPGESVTSEGVRVRDGKALVVLSAGGGGVAGWRSTLAPVDRIVLTAPENAPWSERWQLNVSTLWHAETAGIPAVQPGGVQAGQQWQPWPGESVTVAVTRPSGAAGHTLVLDRSALRLVPGQRAQEAALSLTLRSSQGGRHDITLPEGAALTRLTVDGRALPVSAEQAAVSLPITPGSQQVEIGWNQPGGIEPFYRTPRVDMSIPGVNAEVEAHLPADRWVLMAGGPLMGPAVLFWSWIPVLVVVALALARLKLTPLGFWQWFLLLLGLSQSPLALSTAVVLWFLAMAGRGRMAMPSSALTFNFRQAALAAFTVVAMLLLFEGIRQGLLGSPEMRISGNGSSGTQLRWYQDINGEKTPAAWIVSLPVIFYRALMLLWALWLAFSVPKWLRWAWECYSADGYWRRNPVVPPSSAPKPPAS